MRLSVLRKIQITIIIITIRICTTRTPIPPGSLKIAFH